MSDTTPDSAAAAVKDILARAEIPVTDEEFADLVAMYPVVEAMRADLWIPEVRYGQPAIIYPAR